jgi:anthranilate synthase component 1
MVQNYSISKSAFVEMATCYSGEREDARKPYTLVGRHIAADLDTPVSALLKIRRGQHCFLLESVERGSQVGRYSFLGTEPSQIFTAEDGRASVAGIGGVRESAGVKPLDMLEKLLATRRVVVSDGTSAPRFSGGAVGFAGYETACSLEPVRPARNIPSSLPDAAFAFYDTLVVFDHVQRTAQVLTQAPLDGDPGVEYEAACRRIECVMQRLREPASLVGGRSQAAGKIGCPVRSNLTQAEYEGMVEAAKEHIAAGDIIQVVLSQRFERETGADPFNIYRALRMVNPSPYMFFLQIGDLYLVGASPEMLVQVQGSKVSTHPIAGTRPRGSDRAEDDKLERELLTDEKERAEHLMLADLGRNDIGRIARVGTVKVPRFMQVEHYSHVMHIVSEVEGELKEGLGPVDVLRACFPAGTVSGAPKVRAMQIISELEQDRRGPYAGAAGYIGYDGNMDTAIAIRTLVIYDGVASVQAGAGLVADSVPATEYMETQHKARALLSAIDLAEEIEQEEALPFETRNTISQSVRTTDN